ncbi:MAG TPA: bifunctional nuclease domain-containing protein, partial [Thermoanaerobaculia bacterium]|nr:bifunctional nuclease domain-containing protein [Thermoanaerobaculia bacterium]
MTQNEEPIRMEVKGLMIDPSSNNPIVILRDPESQAFLPIWIGLFEASAIQLGLESVASPRPRTHDLLASLV